jgi:DeoR/GlpR family transcriptional regulator of sugar metabolism
MTSASNGYHAVRGGPAKIEVLMPDVRQLPTPESSRARRGRTLARHARILERLEERDFVSVKELSDESGLTEMSVRRDLMALEADGMITRVRGGATRRQVGEPSRHYAASAQRNSAAKARIARAAVELIPAEAITFFYSGSTVAKTAASLSEELRSSLTIVTNSVPIINEVSTWDDPHLVAIGGTYLPAYMCFVGPQSIEALEKLSADVAIVGCDGLSADGGLTTPHQLVAQIGTTLVNRARHIIVVADSTKVGRRGFTPIAPIESIDVLVTDQDADPDEVVNLRARGVDVRLT